MAGYTYQDAAGQAKGAQSVLLGVDGRQALWAMQQAARSTPVDMGRAAGRVGCQPLAAAAEGHALDDGWGDAAHQLEDVHSCGQGHALTARAGGADPAGQGRWCPRSWRDRR